MRSHPFYLVDVFTEVPLTGNPLALVPDADEIDEVMMRRLAREFNQSETTFLLSPTQPDAHLRLRSFTPTGVEVFGAGHNALGAWWWLAESEHLELSEQGTTELFQEIGQVVLPVEVARMTGGPTRVGMHQSPPRFGAAMDRTAVLADALGVESSELDGAGRVVDTGAAHLLVPASSQATVDRAVPDAEKLRHALAETGGQGCYLYSIFPSEDAPTAYARFFNPTVGIWEDPATGSAAGPLACHLVDQGMANGGETITILQGHAIERASEIRVTVTPTGPVVTGTAVKAAEGTLLLPPVG